MTNRQWRLVSYPEGMPSEANWALSEAPVPEPGPSQMLLRAIYVDVAPYMRGRISPQKNYAAGIKPGDVMPSGAIAEVVRSNAKQFQPGDIVVSDFAFGWQELAVLTSSVVRKVDPALMPLPYWLEALSINGMTAYCALVEAARVKPGDAVVVSAAAGSVGQLAGQIAKIAGCRTIGITSTEEKAAWCREIGYDEAIAYKTVPDLTAAVEHACPRGVDVYIDNTGGPIHDAVMRNLALHARVIVVGSISLAGTFGQPDIGQRFMRQLLIARATMQGFLVGDYQQHHAEARRRIADWYRQGLVKSKFDIAKGIENAPDAFLRLLTSRNVGKQLVQVADEPVAS
jgi:NADPH-dependent curcumin reductase CurA